MTITAATASSASAATHTLLRGQSPLLISVPHAGTAFPKELAPLLTPLALTIPDTDWHVPELYDFAPALGATLLLARYSRYLIDLNRPPDDAALYAGAAKTGLCPTLSFDGQPLYLAGEAALAGDEIGRRVRRYWQPYHDALRAELEFTVRRHGYALLLDAHSIRSVVPRLFSGRLPDVNVGTNSGRSCAASLSERLRSRLVAAPRWTHVIDGRFKGGYITRHYGQPDSNVHAVQFELVQLNYMNEAPSAALQAPAYEKERAAPLRTLLLELLQTMLEWRPG